MIYIMIPIIVFVRAKDDWQNKFVFTGMGMVVELKTSDKKWERMRGGNGVECREAGTRTELVWTFLKIQGGNGLQISDLGSGRYEFWTPFPVQASNSNDLRVIRLNMTRLIRFQVGKKIKGAQICNLSQGAVRPV